MHEDGNTRVLRATHKLSWSIVFLPDLSFLPTFALDAFTIRERPSH